MDDLHLHNDGTGTSLDTFDAGPYDIGAGTVIPRVTTLRLTRQDDDRDRTVEIGLDDTQRAEVGRWLAPPPPVNAAHVADLEMVIRELQELRDGLLKECEEHGAKFTARQEGKWEGGFLMLRGILVDHLDPMLRAWKDGHAFSRAGEQLLGNEG